MPLVSFSAGQVIKSADVNANFGLCVLTDTSRTVTVTHTWTSTQTFSGGASFGAAITSDLIFTDATYDIGKSGATRPRDGFFSRNMVAGGTLAVTGAATLSSTLGVTAGKTTLRNMELSFDRASFDAITLTDTNGAPYAKWIIGQGTGGQADGITFYNSTAGATKFHMSAAGTFRIYDADLLLSTGVVQFNAATSKQIPGATSHSFRNRADTVDNLLIPDNGTALLRNGLTAGGTITTTSGGVDVTTAGAVYKVSGTQVLGARKTGYTNPWGGTLERATARDQSTVTLPQLAQRVAALQTDMEAHGIIGA